MLLVQKIFLQNFRKFLIKTICQNLPNYHDFRIKQQFNDEKINFLLFAHIKIKIFKKKKYDNRKYRVCRVSSSGSGILPDYIIYYF